MGYRWKRRNKRDNGTEIDEEGESDQKRERYDCT